jgi:hypothetical protein
MELQDERNGDTGRLNRRITDTGRLGRRNDQLEIEIHREKVRVWVDGASEFLKDDKKVESLTAALEKLLDGWAQARIKTALAAFGLTALGTMLLAGLAYLGWKGWAGPGVGK